MTLETLFTLPSLSHSWIKHSTNVFHHVRDPHNNTLYILVLYRFSFQAPSKIKKIQSKGNDLKFQERNSIKNCLTG